MASWRRLCQVAWPFYIILIDFGPPFILLRHISYSLNTVGPFSAPRTIQRGRALVDDGFCRVFEARKLSGVTKPRTELQLGIAKDGN